MLSRQNEIVDGDPRSNLLLRRIRLLIVGFIVGLVLSGVTVFPLPEELGFLVTSIGAHSGESGLPGWLVLIRDSLASTQANFPFLFYGYDWLAFAHLVIAVLFIGPFMEPVKNVWVIQWGMIACGLVLPLALVCGQFREIPFYWRLIDCSFGVVGIVPLYLCLRWIREIEAKSQKDECS